MYIEEIRKALEDVTKSLQKMLEETKEKRDYKLLEENAQCVSPLWSGAASRRVLAGLLPLDFLYTYPTIAPREKNNIHEVIQRITAVGNIST